MGLPLKEFDTVELMAPVHGPEGLTFPAGTHAAVVDLGPDYALVEVVEADGVSHGPFEAKPAELRIVKHAWAA